MSAEIRYYKQVGFIVGTLYRKNTYKIQTGTPCTKMRAEVGYLQMWVEYVAAGN